MAKSLVPTIEDAYSASPRAMTDPRFTDNIFIKDNSSCNLLQNRMHILLCYKKKCDEDSGWHIGGWFKESLGKALVENPILAGRLRRTNDEAGLEIVSNDAGVRCIEAQLPLSLDEFFQSKRKHDDAHSELIYWKDVDETDLQFSPLFYVQITNFQCGSYAVGISFSLLLADPVLMSNFLNKWADFHQSMAYDGKIPKMPVFYTPKFKQVGFSSPASTIPSTSSKVSIKTTKTTMFSISTDAKLNNSCDEIYKYFVQVCIEEAESKICINMSSNFTLITKQPSGETKVERSSKQSIFGSPKSLKYELNPLSWEALKANEIAFRSGNVPIDVSHWVACDDSLEGLVLVSVSSLKENKSCMNILVMLPNQCD